MEIKNNLTVTREGRVIMGKEGDGSSQGTCMEDPRTKPRSGRIERGRQGWGWSVGPGRVMRENADNCNSTTIKNISPMPP